MKKIKRARPTIFQTLLPEFIDLVSRCEEFFTLFNIESNEFEI